MVGPFSGKVVMITGALGGIGRAVASAFADGGASLFLIDQRADDDGFVAELAAAGAGDVALAGCDVGDADAVAAVTAQATARFGRLDVLVNVAGMMPFKPIDALTAAEWRAVLGVNLIAPALFTGHALRVMPAGSAIVNVASVHARRTSPLVAPYAASKAALVSLTRSTAIEGRDRGIRCNAVLPGAIDTAMLRNSPNIRSGAEVIDPADIGDPVDVAALTCFLASDAARFITGEDIVADGGRMGRL
ncbi:SDR family oxidoreductase [Sphingomonas koreensis]|nr:SDR family oxidoreductase [Sphingomonas koreensis]